MPNSGFAGDADSPVGLAQAIAKVRVFPVHKEPFTEQAHLLDGFSRDEHARTGNEVNGALRDWHETMPRVPEPKIDSAAAPSRKTRTTPAPAASAACRMVTRRPLSFSAITARAPVCSSLWAPAWDS